MTAAAAALVLAVVAGVTLSLSLGGKPVASSCSIVLPSGSTFRLTPEQAQNAATISAVALKMGLPDHAVTVALAAALQESFLQNLPYGDKDSVGLFQQRPSEGWGTRTQILDPVYAATAFYTHLEQIPGWASMAVTDAAQAVQRSAAPSAYATWEEQARGLAIALTGKTEAGFSCRLTSFNGPPPSPSDLSTTASYQLGMQPFGVALGSKVGWTVASWVVAHAWNYHIHQVSYAGWTWTASSGRWAHKSSATGGSDVVQYS